jgi:hypothetical protein
MLGDCWRRGGRKQIQKAIGKTKKLKIKKGKSDRAKDGNYPTTERAGNERPREWETGRVAQARFV